MTTNAVITGNSVGFNTKQKANYDFFSKEFLNRIDEIIEFKKLNENDINRIIYIELNKYNKRHRCNLLLDIEDINKIKEKSSVDVFGVRKLNRNIRKELDNKLIEKIFI